MVSGDIRNSATMAKFLMSSIDDRQSWIDWLRLSPYRLKTLVLTLNRCDEIDHVFEGK